MTDQLPVPVAPSLPYVELHVHSAFSLLRAGSSVEALVARAADIGVHALALTDFMTLAGVVRFQAACAQYDVAGLVGAELAIADPVFGDMAAPAHLVVLAEHAAGYARLCQLLSDANLRSPDHPLIPFAALAAAAPDGLIVLSGGSKGTLVRLLRARYREHARTVAQRYHDLLGPERLFVELQHHQLPDSRLLVQDLVWIAEEAGLHCVATNGVCYAAREDYPIYDLLTCVRLGLSVDSPHRERPCNDEAYLKSPAQMYALFTTVPGGEDALRATTEIADRCQLSLLKGVCTAPRVVIPVRRNADQPIAAALRGGAAGAVREVPKGV